MSIMSRARGSDKWALKIEQVMQFRMKWLEVPSIDYWSTIIEPSLLYASRSHWFCCCLLLAHWRNCLWRMKWCSCFSLLHGMFTFCLRDSANSCDFENLCTRAASGVDSAAILLNEFTGTLWRWRCATCQNSCLTLHFSHSNGKFVHYVDMLSACRRASFWATMLNLMSI